MALPRSTASSSRFAAFVSTAGGVAVGRGRFVLAVKAVLLDTGATTAQKLRARDADAGAPVDWLAPHHHLSSVAAGRAARAPRPPTQPAGSTLVAGHRERNRTQGLAGRDRAVSGRYAPATAPVHTRHAARADRAPRRGPHPRDVAGLDPPSYIVDRRAHDTSTTHELAYTGARLTTDQEDHVRRSIAFLRPCNDTTQGQEKPS